MALKDTKQYRMNSFFSGIGGFDLAFERHNFVTSFYCENDPFCRTVLAHHWPQVANASDICNLDAEDIPQASFWTAGFPCQDLSIAKVPHGRSGFRGKNSSLFFKFYELLGVHQPQVILLENVAGLLNSHRGADFTSLLKALTELGYAVAWRVLNARYFGVPQSRPRVFICAWMDNPKRAVGSLFEKKCAPMQKGERLGFITPSRCDLTGAIVPHISYCISATSGRHTGLDWARSYVTYEDGVRRLTPLECERLQGFPDNWSRVWNEDVTPIHGYDTERYSAIGNAVAIPVAEWIAKRIRARFDKQLSDLGCQNNDLCNLSEEFTVPSVQNHDLYTRDEIKWQRGGCAFDGVVVHAQTSTTLTQPIESRFVDALEKGRVLNRYFLSANAAQGIIRRIERRQRNLFAPLDTMLRALAEGKTLRPYDSDTRITPVRRKVKG